MANKKKKYVTVAPSGVTIARNGNSFVVKWKIADKNYGGGQSFRYATNINGKWTKKSVGKTATSASFSISESSIYPSSNKYLTRVVTENAGRRKNWTQKDKINGKKEDVDYETIMSPLVLKAFDFQKPGKPSVSFSLSNYYTCTLSVSTGSTGSDHVWVRQIEWATAFLANSDITDGKKVPKSAWDSVNVTSGVSMSRAFSENTTTIASGSHTRWVKVRAVGVAGNSDWVYVRHVYAQPGAPKVTSASAVKVNNTYAMTVKWDAPQSPKYPVDSLAIQYAISTTNTTPSGWQDAIANAGNAKNGTYTFAIDATVELDQSLYLRVNSKHDDHVTYGGWYRAVTGTLKAPTNLSVVLDDTTHKATVSATNASDVPTAFLVVHYSTNKNPSGWDVGIIPNGASPSQVQVQCDDWTGLTKRFSVRAVWGSARKTSASGQADRYAVTQNAYSATVSDGGAVPSAPGTVNVNPTDIPGTIRVDWSWTWTEATIAELSWADHPDAWESTEEPSSYQVPSTHVSAWNISNLETGIVWYVKVKLGKQSGDAITWGPYSDTKSIDLSSAPVAPVLSLSAGAIAEDGDVTVSWAYSSTDGTGQASATVALATVAGTSTTYTTIGQVLTAQQITLNAAELNWTTGQSYAIAVKVTSESGHTSEWSEPVIVYVVEPLTATISATSLVAESITDDGVTRDVNSLKVMPMTVTVTGAGNAGTTTVAIERTADYQVDRPDESQLMGYEGETIVLITQTGEAQMTIDRESLIGRLDDGASYQIVATVSDSFGQSATARLPFEVHWTHQALMPVATVVIDNTEMIAKITPTAPTGYANGDAVDIYRLSVDKPMLIYEGAEFGTTYVDPYPTIGDFGGYRVVYRTIDGDYITEDMQFAWLDVNDSIENDANIIDFGTGRVLLTYNIDIGSSWSKDFQETQYLGGSVQGDWNPAVSRTSTVSGAVVNVEDPQVVEAMRRLAVWPGICHVRTKDGSSYAADVQVSEDTKQNTAHKVSTFSLKITRVDPEGYEGMTLAEWNDLHDEE